MVFREYLEKAIRSSGVCVGIDPVYARLPEHLRETAQGMEQFCELVIASTAPYTAAFKPNLAFFESQGGEGEALLEHVIGCVRGYAPEAMLIGDGKRGDIGSTAEHYAAAMFDRWGFDAVTVNPYFGTDGIRPFAERSERGVYLLALTSNSSGGELQDHGGKDNPLFVKVAELAEQSWNSEGNIGLVVGATHPDRIERVRRAAPSLPFLLPGVGAQGGDLETAVRYGLHPEAPPGLINSSRGIIYASSGEDFAERAAEAAAELRERIGEIQRGLVRPTGSEPEK